MIKRAGENVYPNVIEDRLAEMPGVAYCAVIGMPDQKLGEKLCAFVQPIEGNSITFNDMISHFKEIGMAVFEFPERFETVNGWPLTPINKINKRLLRAHITSIAVTEGSISKEHGDEYLKKDKITVDDVLQARVTIDFTGEPS
jgi:non-ribosomal peptide synthetase component E (peptide arylation enzyme)